MYNYFERINTVTEKATPGKLPPASILVNISKLVDLYYSAVINPEDPSQRIAFGTSGHRGSSFKNNFNEPHILAIAQAISEYRLKNKINGPLYLGKDTHALSEPAIKTALEVFAANGVEVFVQENNGSPLLLSSRMRSWLITEAGPAVLRMALSLPPPIIRRKMAG